MTGKFRWLKALPVLNVLAWLSERWFSGNRLGSSRIFSVTLTIKENINAKTLSEMFVLAVASGTCEVFRP